MELTWGEAQLHIQHQICYRRRIQGLSSNSLASEKALKRCRPLGSGSLGFSASCPFLKCYTLGDSSSCRHAYDVRNKDKAHKEGSDVGGLDAGSRN
jgi:hypothetical protein